jgi:hypothetical protein
VLCCCNMLYSSTPHCCWVTACCMAQCGVPDSHVSVHTTRSLQLRQSAQYKACWRHEAGCHTRGFKSVKWATYTVLFMMRHHAIPHSTQVCSIHCTLPPPATAATILYNAPTTPTAQPQLPPHFQHPMLFCFSLPLTSCSTAAPTQRSAEIGVSVRHSAGLVDPRCTHALAAAGPSSPQEPVLETICRHAAGVGAPKEAVAVVGHLHTQHEATRSVTYGLCPCSGRV